MLFVWSALLGGIYILLFRSGPKIAISIAVVVLSRWLLDVLTHRPDMPLTLGDRRLLGFGLWTTPFGLY